ncbi:hypothetical protein [Glutamicibacter arilaitensis]|uniref:hypothetical protein n=2 Tax=Glutamicibacter arilaitensis TaxID=256701 RepID=UPI003FCF5B99
MKKLAPLVLIAALALTGCTTGNQSADATPSATATPSASATAQAASKASSASTSATATRTVPSEMPTTSPEPTSMFKSGQAWADDAYDSWFKGMQYTYIEDKNAGMFCTKFDDLKGYRDCVPNDPHAYIESFTSTEPGHLIVTLAPDSRWQGGEYDTEGSGLPFVAGNVGPRLQQDGFPFLKVTAKIAGTDESYTYEMFPSDAGR